MKSNMHVVQSSDTDEPHSLIGAATEVFSAGQQLILDRIDLLQAEVTSEASRLGLAGAFLAAAATFGLLGWTVLTVALAVLLDRWLPLDASLAIAAVLNVGIAGFLGFLGYRKLTRPSSFDQLVPAERLKNEDPNVPPGFDQNPRLTEPPHA